MAKITALEQKTYQGKPSGFKVTFDDGRSGNLQEKESDKNLRVGDTVSVVEIPYTSKAGVASTLYGVRLISVPAQPQGNPLPPAPAQQAPKASAPASVALSEAAIVKIATDTMGYAVDCFISNKFEWDTIPEKADYLFRLALGEARDAITGKR
jgi:hypothetical protein